MEAEPTDSPAAAASCSRWVLLNRYGYRRDHSGVADAEKTSVAAAFTSTGRPFGVSFCLKAAPASSSFYYDWADEHEDTIMEEPQAGNAARPPSLSLLPACFFPMDFQRGITHQYPLTRAQGRENTGVLRRGEDGEILVAQLEVTGDHMAELCVNATGEAATLCRNAGEPMRRWRADAAVSVGDRFLCWVDYFHGVLLCDMASDTARLRLLYVSLPDKPDGWWPWPGFDGSRPDPRWSMNLAPTGAGALRLVSVEPRRGCCGSRETTCAHGRSGFAVTTWTLRLTTEENTAMRWTEDGVLHGDELWAFPGYEGVPRVTVKYPIVSPDDPDAVCFMVCEEVYVYKAGTRLWMVEVDTRGKALRSVVCEMSDRWGEGYHLAARLRC
ncbi:unnamed protein product [Urochloa decumbens]|uniref:DUF1618 domain-containing protein n=1 Tax=Urochloa decumbens TaxID=240449 RepID=A0ABC9B178_9POAL